MGGGELDFLKRRVNEFINHDVKAKIIVDATHIGENIIDVFSELKAESIRSIVLRDGDYDEEFEAFLVTKKDVLGNLYILKDSLRITTEREMFGSLRVPETLYDGIEDFVIRNIDMPTTHVFTSNDQNQLDNMYYALSITAWFAEFDRLYPVK